MKVICVTGTPGTGKTTVAKYAADALGYKHIDVRSLVRKSNISDSFDKKRNCWVVDTRKLNQQLKKELTRISKDGAIIDSHLSHYFPAKQTALCIVTKCSLKTLKNRLEKRRYSKEKVRENMDAEIFDICLVEANEQGHKTLTIDTTKTWKQKILSKLK